jgi:hypothetical protein
MGGRDYRAYALSRMILLFGQVLIESDNLAIFDLPVLLHQDSVGFPMIPGVASFAGPDIDHVFIPVIDVGALPHDDIEAHGVETVDVGLGIGEQGVGRTIEVHAVGVIVADGVGEIGFHGLDLRGLEKFPDRQYPLGDNRVAGDGNVGRVKGMIGVGQGVFWGSIRGFGRVGRTGDKKTSCGEEKGYTFHVCYFENVSRVRKNRTNGPGYIFYWAAS